MSDNPQLTHQSFLTFPKLDSAFGTAQLADGSSAPVMLDQPWYFFLIRLWQIVTQQLNQAALFGPTPIANVAGPIYMAPINTTTTITQLTSTNESAASATLTLWLVRSGDTRNNGNIIYGAAAAGQSQPAGPSDPVVLAVASGLVLGPGDAIHALSNTNQVLNLNGSGWTSIK